PGSRRCCSTSSTCSRPSPRRNWWNSATSACAATAPTSRLEAPRPAESWRQVCARDYHRRAGIWPVSGRVSMIIRRIDIISAGKIGGIIGAAMGLLAGLFMLVFSGMIGSMVGDGGGFLAVGGGFAAVIILPIIYGIFGFLGTLINALIYNLAAGFVGGVRIETE